MKCDDLVYKKLKGLFDTKGSWKAVAEYFDVHPTFISNIIAGVAEPSFRMCQMMGIKRITVKTTTYEEITYE